MDSSGTEASAVFRRSLLRGLERVGLAWWSLLSTTHNLPKLYPPKVYQTT